MLLVHIVIHFLLYVLVINNGVTLCFSTVKIDEQATGTKVTHYFPITYTQIPAVVDLLSASASNVNAFVSYRHPHNITISQFEAVAYKNAQRSWITIGY